MFGMARSLGGMAYGSSMVMLLNSISELFIPSVVPILLRNFLVSGEQYKRHGRD